jgi:hypothetical protein
VDRPFPGAYSVDPVTDISGILVYVGPAVIGATVTLLAIWLRNRR